MSAATVIVRGVELDPQTRCAHYRSPLDVVAIEMACCRTFYACKDCHDALADHPLEVWRPDQRAERAILCGVCRARLTIGEYLASGSACPACGAGFNPGCRNHHHFYFADE